MGDGMFGFDLGHGVLSRLASSGVFAMNKTGKVSDLVLRRLVVITLPAVFI